MGWLAERACIGRALVHGRGCSGFAGCRTVTNPAPRVAPDQVCGDDDIRLGNLARKVIYGEKRSMKTPFPVNRKIKFRFNKLTRIVRKSLGELKPVDEQAVIDRSFRFLEMIFLTVLVGALYSVVDSRWSIILTLLMNFAAGLYIALPLVRWLKPAKGKKLSTLGFALAFGSLAIAITFPLQALVRATVDFNEDRALQEYVKAKEKGYLLGCLRSRRKAEICEKSADEYADDLLKEIKEAN